MVADGVLDESALTGESRPVERPSGDLVRSGAVNAAGGVRPAGDRHRRGEHLRRHRPAGPGGRTGEGAVGAARRSLRHDLHPGDAGDRGGRVARLRRPDAGADRADGRDPVPADPRGADRGRRRHLAGGASAASSSRAAARSRRSRAARCCCSTRPARSRRASRRSPTSRSFGDLDADEVLRLAASLDQVSPHVLAAAIVRAARERGMELVVPGRRSSRSTAPGSRAAWADHASRSARRRS